MVKELNQEKANQNHKTPPGGEKGKPPLDSNQASHSNPPPTALPLPNRRSRCRSSVSTANRRRSAPRVFGQSSSANPFTVPRKILCASATEAAANATLPARRSSPQVTPSLVAEYHTVPPRKSRPHTTQ